MTPISHSRGIRYSAPPKKTTRDDGSESAADEPTESEDDIEAPSVADANSSVTDANWSGTVPADD